MICLLVMNARHRYLELALAHKRSPLAAPEGAAVGRSDLHKVLYAGCQSTSRTGMPRARTMRTTEASSSTYRLMPCC